MKTNGRTIKQIENDCLAILSYVASNGGSAGTKQIVDALDLGTESVRTIINPKRMLRFKRETVIEMRGKNPSIYKFCILNSTPSNSHYLCNVSRYDILENVASRYGYNVIFQNHKIYVNYSLTEEGIRYYYGDADKLRDDKGYISIMNEFCPGGGFDGKEENRYNESYWFKKGRYTF